MEVFLGIDLGTTTTLVASAIEGETGSVTVKVLPIRQNDGRGGQLEIQYLPSVAYFPPDAPPLVGKEAETRGPEEDVSRFVRAVKRQMGRRLLLPVVEKEPHEVSALYLAYALREGAERILLVPLYPQYSATTTATVFDKAAEALGKMRAQPAIRTLPPFPDDAAYIAALAASVREQVAALDPQPADLLLSFHGLPVAYVEKGDPYRDHCLRTAAALQQALSWPEDKFHLSFQSRVGRAEWLTPYTDETLARLAREGVKTLAVVTPGFIADCVETLEEIAIAGGETFHENGGENFTCLACLNDSDQGIDMLEVLLKRELSGWIG